MTLPAGLRLPILAFTVAAVQATVFDRTTVAALDHIDLPLAVVIALAITRPADAVVSGFVFGLAVDAFSTRLFGLHGLAYALLAPVAAVLPTSGLRTRTEALLFLVAAQAVFAATVVMVGTWIADGAIELWPAGRYLQITVWAVALAWPLTVALGGRSSLVGAADLLDPATGPGTSEWAP